jgi:threonine dehydratase
VSTLLVEPPVTGWRCAVCGASTPIDVPLTWRCPNATASDRQHAPQIVQTLSPLRSTADRNPFVAFQPYLAVDAFGAAHGLGTEARGVIVDRLDAAVAAVAGVGFHHTPFERADALSEALGFGIDGGVWVKDETGQVAGSHKARHLFTILVHLVVAEQLGLSSWADVADRPKLAIASCGNAAIAAATLAAAATWPIEVFVPAAADSGVLSRLRELGAEVVTCARRAADPPGDPCIHRFREAVGVGRIPFSVQGPENAWCLDGGRTIGWEMARHMEEHVSGPPLDRIFAQIGAGAFAASIVAGFRMSGVMPRLHAVQTVACAPLARAWPGIVDRGIEAAASRWSSLMWPWEHVGASLADGILDDETYDWLPVSRAMVDGGGSPVVVTEAHVAEANDLGRATTGVNASHTGTAGLAGLIALREQVGSDERVAVVFSGVRR